jgi:hypothetical protein
MGVCKIGTYKERVNSAFDKFSKIVRWYSANASGIRNADCSMTTTVSYHYGTVS